jgi:hypothetical protein
MNALELNGWERINKELYMLKRKKKTYIEVLVIFDGGFQHKRTTLDGENGVAAFTDKKLLALIMEVMNDENL